MRETMIHHRRVIILASVLGLAACSDPASLKRQFGFTRDAPDEFQVTTRAPLEMPPSESLPAPSPGATRPQEMPLSQQAEAILTPDVALNKSAKPSAGERAILAKAGPSAPSTIRNDLDAEADQQRQQTGGVTDKLMFWQDTKIPGTVVDPAAEKQRLQQGEAQPQIAATPKAEPVAAKGDAKPDSSSGFFDWLF